MCLKLEKAQIYAKKICKTIILFYPMKSNIMIYDVSNLSSLTKIYDSVLPFFPVIELVQIISRTSIQWKNVGVI